LLVDLWQPVLGLKQLGVHDNFFEVGGDSIKGAILINRLQELLGTYVYVAVIFDAPTVAELADHLRRQYPIAVDRICGVDVVQESLEWSPLVELNRSDSNRPPLFFAHAAGGDVFCYAALAHQLGTEQSFYGLQSFGLAAGHSPLTDIPEMASRYLEEVRRVQPEGPYLLGGWSIGGNIAFEMAQQLQRAGQEVALLVLIDTFSPTVTENALEVDEETRLQRFKFEIATKPDIDSEEFSRLYQVFCANIDAMMNYEPKSYPGRITFLRASERLGGPRYDPAQDWRLLAADGVDVHMMPGNHYSILKEPAVLALADRLKVCLNATQKFEAAGSI
jgi:thioesterase domain-containing protein